MKRINGVTPKRLSLLTLVLIMLCSCIMGIVGLLGGFVANAADSRVTLSFSSGSFTSSTTNAAALKSLYQRIGGSSVKTYADLKTYLGRFATKQIPSSFLNSLNDGDTTVEIGGYTWDLVYVSEDTSGDVIVTLWLNGSNNLQSWSGNNYSSDATGNAYPSNMYSNSYIRSYLVGNNYATSASELSTSGLSGTIWQTFVSTYDNYLVAPARVAWQEDESEFELFNWSYNAHNSAYRVGGPSVGTFSGSYNWTGKTNYGAWKNDKIWIPSIAETGYSSTYNGIWGTDAEQRTNTGYSYGTWTRSGRPNWGNYSHHLDLSGNGGSGTHTLVNAATTNVVRPAIHLNLTKIDDDVNTVNVDFGSSNNGISRTQKAAVKSLFERIGVDKLSYRKLKDYIDDSGNLSALDLKQKNVGNTTVTLGGYKWDLVYVSEDTSGDVIVTLWLDGSDNRQQWSGGWAEDASNGVPYPSSMYSNSYIRSYLVGNLYSTSRTELSASGVSGSIWQTFATNYNDFLVEPAYVEWQEDESEVKLFNWSYNANNSAYRTGGPSVGGFQGTYNYTGKENYGAWQNDKIWIPSIYETGYDAENPGYWSTDIYQRSNTGYNYGTWTRSGRYYFGNYAYRLDLSGNGGTGIHTAVNNATANAVRPAIHLNLSKVFDALYDVNFHDDNITATSLSDVTDLYNRIGGSDITSYTQLKEYIDENGNLSSSALLSKNGSDTLVVLGDMVWNLVYVSETTSGDVIATLWLADSDDLKQWNNWYHIPSYGWAYPSSMYSSSYIRAYLNGGRYISYTSESPTVEGGTLATAEQSQLWANFATNFGAFLSTPSEVEWQLNQRAVISIGSSNDYPNDAAGKTNSKWAYAHLNYDGKGESVYNTDYFAWANDKFWLPSNSETASNGIWRTSTSQRVNSFGSWCRSGFNSNGAGGAYIVAANGNSDSKYATATYAVRPAIHLNLAKMAEAVEEEAFMPYVTNTAKGADANDGLTYNADFQAAVRFSAAGSEVTRVTIDGVTVPNGYYKIENGLLYAKNAGEYTVTLSAHNAWYGGSNGEQQVTFTVNQKQLVISWDFYHYDELAKLDKGAYYWNYDGKAHGAYAYLDGDLNGNLSDLPAALTVRYSLNGNDWFDCDPSNPAEFNNINVAKHFVKAELTFPDANYKIVDTKEGTGRTEFEIKALPLTVSWNFGYDNAHDDDGYYWIYDGLTHEISAELVGKIVEDDDVEVDLKYFKGSTPTFAAANYALPKNVDKYTAYASLKGEQKGNYYIVTDDELTYVSQQFKIIKHEITVEWNANSDGTYSWDFSGYDAEWVLNDKTDDSFNEVMWFALSENETEDLGLTVSYASVSSGVVGEYSSTAPVNVGTYSVKVTIDNANFALKSSTLQFTIAKKVLTVSWTANADGKYVWRYDGAAHSPEPELLKAETDVLNSGKAPVVVLAPDFTKPVTVGKNYVATAALSPDADGYYLNFALTNETQKFDIDKCLITDITFFESDGKTAAKNEYDWGDVKGAGPGYTAVAKTSIYDGANLIEQTFTLTVSYLLNGKAVAYGTDENWNVDVSEDPTKGYRAMGTLPAAWTTLYELDNDSKYFKFIIHSGTGSKEEAEVTWVVFTGATEFVTLEDLISDGGKAINLDGEFGYISAVNYGTEDTPEYIFTFIYNGTAQAPVALYIKEDESYEYLPVSAYGSRTDVGEGTAHLKDSDEYQFADGAYECAFVIAPLDIKLSWSKTTKLEFNDAEQAPAVSLVKDYIDAEWYTSVIGKFAAKGGQLAVISQTKETFVGEYVSEALLSENFNIVDGGGAMPYEITPKKLYSSLITWTAGDEFGSRVPEDPEQNLQYYSWSYDGDKHCPVPELWFSFTQNGEKKQLKMVVSGATGEVGSHYAYAELDPSEEYNKNFVILDADGKEITPKCRFVILKLRITKIIWVGAEVGEDFEGETITIDDKTYEVIVNDKKTVCGTLQFVYNGLQQSPVAYYYDGNEKLVPLSVEGGQRNVGTGFYLVHVTNDFDFVVSTECKFIITPRPLSFEWVSDLTDEEGNYVFEWSFDGAEHKPSITDFENVAEGETIDSDSISISGAINAGEHTAVLTVNDKNYTFAVDNTKTFTITTVDITELYEWISDHRNEDDTDYDFVWEYNAATHSPSLTLKHDSFTLADGESVTFTFNYVGETANVGTHKATAVLKSATANGVQLDIRNFTIDLDKDFEITPYVITVEWEGNPEEGTYNGTYTWVYTGKEICPTAKYTLWSGEVTAEIEGGGINANDYIASVKLPAGLLSNCVFATVKDEDGNDVSCGEHAFTILRKEVTIVWVFDDDAKAENGTYYWVYDGKAHAPEAYIADKDGKATEQKLQVEGAVENVGTGHVASAMLPDSANYMFKDDDNHTKFTIKVKTVDLKWVDNSPKADGKDFTWTYNGTSTFAPEAIIINADGTDFTIDGKTVKAIISGGAQNAGTHTATAALNSTNYALVDTAHLTQDFTILKLKLTAGTGKDVWWVDKNDDAAQFTGKKDGVYTYVYTGSEQHPVLSSKRSLTFAYEWFKTGEEGDTEITAIVGAGDYKIKVSCTNPNYELPAAATSALVKITPKSVEIKWRNLDNILYNGKDQAPEAYYVGTDGGEHPLKVTVEGDHFAAGEYTASANFIAPDKVINYAIGKNSTQKYTILQRSIKIEWGDKTQWDYDGDPHVPSVRAHLSDALESDLPKVKIYAVILDKNGKVIMNGTDYANSVINSGTYYLELRLDGDKETLKNYKLSDDNGESLIKFTIDKIKLIVIAEDKTVSYGEDTPELTAIFGEEGTGDDAGKIFHGFVGGDTAENLKLIVDGKIAWLDTDYVSGCTPGDYKILIDEGVLGALLQNYTLDCRTGIITVTASAGTVVWYGDGYTTDPDFVYDGAHHVPEAYLQGYGDDAIPLSVIFVDEDGNVIENATAINVGKYRVKAIPVDGYEITAFEYNYFNIVPREIKILLGKITAVYGEVTSNGDNPALTDLLTEEQIELLWSYGTETRPVEGDDLKLSFAFSFAPAVKNGFVQAGEYYVVASYDETNINYKVTFEYEDEETAVTDHELDGIYFIDKAQITDTSKQGSEWYYDETVIEKYQSYFIRIDDKHTDEAGNEVYRYVQYAGDQSAAVTISYSSPYLSGRDEIPAVDDEEGNAFFPNSDKNNIGIADKGVWIINYKIEIDNHYTYYGRWVVSIKLADEYVIIIFLKPYEIQYGDEVPANLAEILVDGGYVEISGGITDTEYFKSIATAHVPLGYNRYVTNRTKVGTYNVIFELNLPEDSVLSPIYKRSNAEEDSNLDAYVIKPRKLEVLWGETQYLYDGKTHVPMPVIGNWVTEDPLTLVDIADGKTYTLTDGGVTVTLSVIAEGNFKSSGGHKVTLSIDNSNYVIAATDAVHVISIKGTFPWWLVFLLGALTATAIIIFITLLTKLRHRNATIARGITDREGFYDPLGYIDDAGFGDPYGDPTIGDDGFDYDEMWNNYVN